MTKLCKDCRWASDPAGPPLDPAHWHRWVCLHPKSLRLPLANLVTGNSNPPKPMKCDLMRLDWPTNEDRCNAAGRHWEAREPEPKFGGVIGFGEALTDKDRD